MPMNPDDAIALAEFDAEQAAQKPGLASGFLLQNRLQWLRRLVGDLQQRVNELEAGGVPEVIAIKDAEIASRDRKIAEHAERVAKLEAVKLPEPGKFFRDQMPLVKDHGKVEAPSLSDREPVADDKTNPHRQH
jgi:hypothetical protein